MTYITAFSATCNNKPTYTITPSDIPLNTCQYEQASFLHVDYFCKSIIDLNNSTLIKYFLLNEFKFKIANSSSTVTTTTDTFTNTPTNFNITTFSPYLIMDFCPGAAKTIDCSASGEFVYFVDAFYGVSDQVPAVCEYK